MSDLVRYEGQAQQADDSQLYEAIRQLYRTAYAITGYRIDKDKILEIDVPATVTLIKDFHPRRDYEDLEKAVKWGALGKYGEFTGINAKTIINWLDSYISSPEFKDKLRDNKPKAKELPPPDLDYNSLWEEGKAQIQEGRTPKGLAVLYFNAGNKLGKFDWKDQDFIEDCKFEARKKMVERLQSLENREMFKDLKKNLKNEESEAFKAECRRQAVLLKFQDEIKGT